VLAYRAANRGEMVHFVPYIGDQQFAQGKHTHAAWRTAIQMRQSFGV